LQIKKDKWQNGPPVFGFCLPILLLGGTESAHPLLPLPVRVLGALDLEYSCATQQKGVPTPCEARQGG